MPHSNIIATLFDIQSKDPNAYAFGKRNHLQQWEKVTLEQFWKDVVTAAHYLRTQGMEKDDLVIIVARPSYFWEVLDKAVAYNGGRSVTTDIWPNDQMLKHLEENETVFATILGKHFDSLGMASYRHYMGSVLLEEQVFTQMYNFEFDSYSSKNWWCAADDVYTIVFTSGTTGQPKGVPVTHRQIQANVEIFGDRYATYLSKNMCTISWLSMSHLTSRVVSLNCLTYKVTQFLLDDPKQFLESCQEIKPDFLVVVPRLIQKVHQRINEIIDSLPNSIKYLLQKVISRQKDGLHMNNTSWLLERVKRWTLGKIMGSQIQFLVSGSAPLSMDSIKLFQALGLPIYEAYGMTESPLLLSLNSPITHMAGTVGVPSDKIEIKIADDGEILVKSELIPRRYYGRNSESIVNKEGFLETGDLGSFKMGFLQITGRKKELLKTSTGRQIPPTPIEDAINKIPGVDQAIVVGDNQKYLSVLVTINDRSSKEIIERHLQNYLSKNKSLFYGGEFIEKIKVLNRSFSQEKGELTPSLKLRRSKIIENFESEINELYLQP